VFRGDTFIFFAQFGKDGLEELKAINVFGNSNKPSSKHYTDQLEMFVNMELRSVVLENDAIKKQGIMYYPQ
jgi:acyl-homoserine lactone acylase PvdQ